MDQYGCVQCDSKEDASVIRAFLSEGRAATFPLTKKDSIGCLIVILVPRFTITGFMPFGGSPRDHIYVGIYGRGCSHFRDEPTHGAPHPSYFAEKLNITTEEAEWLAEFWDLLFGGEK